MDLEKKRSPGNHLRLTDYNFLIYACPPCFPGGHFFQVKDDLEELEKFPCFPRFCQGAYRLPHEIIPYTYLEEGL